MPRLLDLFCCEGGAGRGYMQAGWDVTGVDIEARFQRRYPGDFIQADALEYLAEHGADYDAIHASPPCQGYTIATAAKPEARAKHARLIEPVRDLLRSSGRPWIMENVPLAPLLNPLVLCGSMFGLTATDDDGTILRLQRHRLFESNVFLYAPAPCSHDMSMPVGGVYGGGRNDREEARTIRKGGYTPSKRVRELLIGVEPETFTLHGLAQSIPPAYTAWLGTQLMEAHEYA